jgi:hypothetical protein
MANIVLELTDDEVHHINRALDFLNSWCGEPYDYSQEIGSNTEDKIYKALEHANYYNRHEENVFPTEG